MERTWVREFNSLGLQLRPKAAKLVTSFLQTCEEPYQMVEVLVEQTKNYFKSRGGGVETTIDEHTIQTVIFCLHEASKVAGTDREQENSVLKMNIDTLDIDNHIMVYNVLKDVKAFDYVKNTKEWAVSTRQPQLFPPADAKCKIFADRYHLMLQRILLQGEFVSEAEASTGNLLPGQRVLTPLESIIGNPGRKTTFGLLSKCDNGTWRMEDLHASFEVKLLQKESTRLITDGCLVMAEGRLRGEVFHIDRLTVPSAVPRAETQDRDQVPCQFFGGNLSEEHMTTLGRSELTDDSGMYVILSEVHLDSARVFDRIQDLFQGYEASGPPDAYVFMGSFCSEPFVPTTEGVRMYREGFERLKFMLKDLPTHAAHQTRYIFIPGPKDPGAELLPRVPLPGYMTCDIAKEIPGAIMATNPCRIRHYTRELVFFRHDVLKVLRRHEVMPLREPGSSLVSPSPSQVREEMARLLMDQAHLIPLPLVESNVLWSFDHTLRLYPLPTAVFVGSATQGFDLKYEQSTFGSVGPFHLDASFYAYYPVKDELEQCVVPDPAG